MSRRDDDQSNDEAGASAVELDRWESEYGNGNRAGKPFRNLPGLECLRYYGTRPRTPEMQAFIDRKTPS